nr:MAG TPA: PsbA, PsbB, PsbC, PsbD, PsbE-FCP supercomplex, PLANT PROTEIN [Caudoviricetes sp.]
MDNSIAFPTVFLTGFLFRFCSVFCRQSVV